MPPRLPRLALALLAAALCACGGGASGPHPAPGFSLPALGGGTVSLSSERGKVVLVNFWATWCDSCREELPTLRELARRRDGPDFALLAVNVDEDASKVPPFAKAHALDFPILLADPGTMSAYRVRDLPTSFLIAPDGTIARRYVGPLDPQAVENDIVGLLNRRHS
ncbi:MAG: TlpA family protein disulfide reductase [Elusimicrobia bacterium]|nr:TlpA family protein disulfide reductase [Elusimicrobiota bacterium]